MARLNKTVEQIQNEIALRETKYKQYIDNSVARAVVYSPSDIPRLRVQTSQKVLRHMFLFGCGSEEAIQFASHQRVCILNFASYKNAGGGYVRGMLAQEEVLCNVSSLYNVLRRFSDTYYKQNKEHLNRGLYTDRAIFTPAVQFDIPYGKIVDVLTCASPNWGAARRNGVSYEENVRVLTNRIEFIADILINQGVDSVILGAWGCGVFKQDANIVCSAFKSVMETRQACSEVIFAVPNTSSKNYLAFAQGLWGKKGE